MKNIYEAVSVLDRKIRDDVVVVVDGIGEVSAADYIAHEKAEQMKAALIKVHGSSEITEESINEAMADLRKNDVITHDGMFLLLESLK